MDLSFWEKDSYFRDIDLLVVGGGIVGLNTARAAKLLCPNWNILVVDRGFLPYGASTRNAGFACFGSISELLDDRKRMADDEIMALVAKRYAGLMRLREVLGDDSIGYEHLGGYEVFTEAEAEVYTQCLDAMDYFNRALEEITGKPAMYRQADEEITKFGFTGVSNMLLNTGEGQVDTGRMMKSLLALVRSQGVEVLGGIGVKGWEETASGVQVKTDAGFSVKARQVVVTTNAFARELLPELAVVPGRAQVLITEPIADLKIAGSFHYDAGYYYFRNVGQRILLGGGRNLDFDGERTTAFGLTTLIQNKLEQLLQEVILPGTSYRIEQRWSGIMGLGESKSTIVKRISPQLCCAVRMGGMGVAIGTLIGEEAAALLAENR